MLENDRGLYIFTPSMSLSSEESSLGELHLPLLSYRVHEGMA